MNYTFDELVDKACTILLDVGCNQEMAISTATALVKAEAQGLKSHGLIRTRQYADHVANGRANGNAKPHIIKERGGSILVDAEYGLAYPACDFAIKEAISRAKTYGISLAGITHSHHFGPAAVHLEAIGKNNMIGLALTNSPAAMPAYGGKKAVFGTNPIAFVFPRKNHEPIMIDLSLSGVARGKLMVAKNEGKTIPEGWAMDKNGNPTTDPAIGLEGMMCPLGGAKGAVLALAVEILCTSLTGSALAFEANSFYKKDGNKPNIGHIFIAIDPSAMIGSDGYHERLETLISTMLTDPEVRLPGERRQKLMQEAIKNGINIQDGWDK